MSIFEKRALPEGYTQVEYLESTGTQWINTGLTTGTGVQEFITEAQIAWSTVSTKRQLSGANNSQWIGANGGVWDIGAAPFDVGKFYQAKNICSLKDGVRTQTLYVDGKLMGSTSATVTSLNDNQQLIFNIASGTNNSTIYTTYSCSARISSWKLTRNGTLIFDGVPCYRNGDGEVGMYDLVNERFLANGGTGAFIVGNVVVEDGALSEILITDRTAVDVDEVAALAEAIKVGTATAGQIQQYLNGVNKGAYGVSDLIRVETAMGYICDRLRDFGYPLVLLAVGEWSKDRLPTADDFNHYFANIAAIRAVLAEHKNSPPVPSSDISVFGYAEANAVEQILADMEELLNRIAAAWFYSNDIYSGEV